MPMVMRSVRRASFAAALMAALAMAACANKPALESGLGSAAPGSQQDFVVNVGDRVFFESDQTDLTPQARATLDKQAQWLATYNRYTFTIEGHADERGTREYNIALGARRAQSVRDYLDLARHRAVAHADDLLRQGASGRGVQRHLVLVAEPARRHRAEREFVIPPSGIRIESQQHRRVGKGGRGPATFYEATAPPCPRSGTPR